MLDMLNDYLLSEARALGLVRPAAAPPEPTPEPVPVAPTLQRVTSLPPGVPTELLALDNEVAEQAVATLGYTAMQDRLTMARLEAKLVDTLRELDIRPFTAESVNEYKHQRQRELQSKESSYGRTIWSWRMVPLAAYASAVPTYALQTALSIKSKMPEAQFAVDELVSTWNGLDDPFLVVHVGYVRFHIDVWDEPSFTGKRTL